MNKYRIVKTSQGFEVEYKFMFKWWPSVSATGIYESLEKAQEALFKNKQKQVVWSE